MRVVPVSGGVDKGAASGVELQAQLSRCFVAGRGGAATPPLRTFFYVDALNLYYGALRDSPYRWLDVSGFCAAALKEKPHFPGKDFSMRLPMLPLLFKTKGGAFEIARIKVFTAPLKKMAWDPDAPVRQKNYLTALKAHDSSGRINIHYGNFSVRPKVMRDAGHKSQKHRVVCPEEKGSDVNLALHMLNDAVNGACDCAVMVSNDADLAAALQMVRARGKLAGVVFPLGGARRPSRQLQENADFYINIDKNNISAVARQLPPVVCNPKTGRGNLRRPVEWNESRKNEEWSGEYGRGFCEDKCGYCFAAPGKA